MLADIASASIGIVVALIVAFPLGGALRKHPAPFYTVAVLIVIAHLAYRATGSYVAQAQVLLDVLNKAYLASALLAIVMFTGVFDHKSAIRHKLQPIRGELSILSFVFICDHMVGYAPSFFPVLGRLFTLRAGMAVSIMAAIVLSILFAVLAATSLRAARARIPSTTWKNIQRASYAMVALLLVHVFLVLGRTAFAGTGSTSAQVALATYTAIIALYAILRIRKAVRDRNAAE
jgi:DMSO/TMAO reductase YedYZ heme-binding membrane subunit